MHDCFLVKVYPKKQQKYRMYLEMRREVKQLEQYTTEDNMISKYKLKTLQNVRNKIILI